MHINIFFLRFFFSEWRKQLSIWNITDPHKTCLYIFCLFKMWIEYENNSTFGVSTAIFHDFVFLAPPLTLIFRGFCFELGSKVLISTCDTSRLVNKRRDRVKNFSAIYQSLNLNVLKVSNINFMLGVFPALYVKVSLYGLGRRRDAWNIQHDRVDKVVKLYLLQEDH